MTLLKQSSKNFDITNITTNTALPMKNILNNSEAFSFLKFVTDKPSRVLSLGLLLFFCILSTLVVMYKDDVIKKMFKVERYEKFISGFDESQFESSLKYLVDSQKAVSATIWNVDMTEYTKSVVYSYHKDTGSRGREFLVGESFPLYSNNDKDILNTVAMQQGDVVCSYIYDGIKMSNLMRDMDGVSFMCMAAIPPRTNEFIGIISLTFKSQKKIIPHSLKFEINKSARNVIKKVYAQ